MYGKKKYWIIFLVVFFVVGFTACSNSQEIQENYYIQKISQVCDDLGYSIVDEDRESLDDDFYDGYCCKIALDNSCMMIVQIGSAKDMSGWVSLNINNNLGSLEEKFSLVNDHATLVVELVNAFVGEIISEADINEFFEDSSNVVRANQFSKEDDLFYITEKHSERNGAVFNYQVDAFADEHETNKIDDESIEESFEVILNEVKFKD